MNGWQHQGKEFASNCYAMDVTFSRPCIYGWIASLLRASGLGCVLILLV